VSRPAADAGTGPRGIAGVLGRVLAALFVLVVVAVVGLVVWADRTVDAAAREWADRAGTSVHRTVVTVRSSYPSGSPLSDESRLRAALGELEGVRVLGSRTRPDGSVELELSLFDPQGLNPFIGHDFVACARITTEPVREAPEGTPRGAVTTTDLRCPSTATFGSGARDAVVLDDPVTATVPHRSDPVPRPFPP
jgi:hypothetical protein